MNFVNRVLAPHLADQGVNIYAPRVTTSRSRRTGEQFKGGGRSFAPWERDLRNLWRQHQGRGIHLTTFADVYALPSDFPGSQPDLQGATFRQRTAHLEDTLAVWASEQGFTRFIPYLATHEFETMVFSDLNALGTLFLGHEAAIGKIAAEVAAFDDIEEINSTPDGAPSKRIGKHIPIYRKYKANDQSGVVNVLEVIELPAIRAACQHFDEWVTKLENLAPLTEDAG